LLEFHHDTDFVGVPGGALWVSHAEPKVIDLLQFRAAVSIRPQISNEAMYRGTDFAGFFRLIPHGVPEPIPFGA
jgi:hypothetical protein